MSIESELRRLIREADELKQANPQYEKYYAGVYDGLWAAVKVACLGEKVESVEAKGQI